MLQLTMIRPWTIALVVLTQVMYGTCKLRLVPGPDKGRLEVLHDGVWGTICDDSFDITDAKVACRELGFNRQHSLPWLTGSGSGTIWLDDMRCRGDELSLAHCIHTHWGKHDCDHSEDVGVFCTNENLVTIDPNIPVVKLMENETETFTCNMAFAFAEPYFYQWTLKENEYSTSKKYIVKGSTLENGNLTCTVTNTAGYVLGTATTIVDIQHQVTPSNPPVSKVIGEIESPLSALWKSLKFYIIGAGVAVLILGVSVVLGVTIARKSSHRKDKMTVNITGNQAHPKKTAAYKMDGEVQSDEETDGNTYPEDSDGEWDQFGGVFSEDRNNGQHYGNMCSGDLNNEQHYGNVCVDADVYQNVSVGENDYQMYQNTMI